MSDNYIVFTFPEGDGVLFVGNNIASIINDVLKMEGGIGEIARKIKGYSQHGKFLMLSCIAQDADKIISNVNFADSKDLAKGILQRALIDYSTIALHVQSSAVPIVQEAPPAARETPSVVPRTPSVVREFPAVLPPRIPQVRPDFVGVRPAAVAPRDAVMGGAGGMGSWVTRAPKRPKIDEDADLKIERPGEEMLSSVASDLRSESSKSQGSVVREWQGGGKNR